jgi:hypothetical protein
MKRAVIITLLVSCVGVAALNAAPAVQKAVSNVTTAAVPKPAAAPKPAASPAKPAAAKPSAPPVALPPTGKETPMAQRVAVLGLLNKRNGLWRDLTMKPGEAVRIGDVVVRLRACETTAPWEHEQLTGAFVQMLVNGSDKKWRRQFSGWLYKETPSLNLVEHPIYDVWTKECRMRHPDIGPETLVVRGGETPAASSTKRSKPNQSPSI